MSQRSVAVFCGSRDAVDAKHLALADATGRAIAARGWTLVYGGGAVGMMGRCARACTAGGGRVVGVLPHAMDSVEIAYRAADELIMVDTMRQRKQIMDDRADAFLVLPGGFGTLEELAEVLTHRFLNYHAKPVVLVNLDGFYDPLLRLFDHFIDAGFAGEAYREHYTVVADVEGAFEALR